MGRSDFDLVVFDCDGVLIDSELMSARTLIALAEPLGVHLSEAYVQQNFLGRSFATVAKTIRQEFKAELPADFEQSYRKTLLATFDGELRATAGVETVLAQLKLRSCVATSSSKERAFRSLGIVGLDRYFDGSVFTASEVARGKPAPDLFLHVAASIGVAPARCIVIEDSDAGIQAGLAAGMTVWRYVGGSHFTDLDSIRQDTPPGVRVFDNWDQFFVLAPELKA